MATFGVSRVLAFSYAVSKTLSRTIQLSPAASESMGRAVGVRANGLPNDINRGAGVRT